ncbi:Hypothetical predicted protein [Xyrichtys novacula]|uniref:Uncharacterized protein n=1 Tax=Xyrichtys novacula TaxID=13765 RepID=A0AAV1EWH5_XYRNO|nr:Hypothetical predicted protein [Xyrichtys novacula]
MQMHRVINCKYSTAIHWVFSGFSDICEEAKTHNEEQLTCKGTMQWDNTRRWTWVTHQSCFNTRLQNLLQVFHCAKKLSSEHFFVLQTQHLNVSADSEELTFLFIV